MYQLVVSNMGYSVDLSQYEKDYNTLFEVNTAINRITKGGTRKVIDGFKIDYYNITITADIFNAEGIADVLMVKDDSQRGIYIRAIK